MARQNLINKVFKRYLVIYIIISMLPLVILSIAGSFLSSKMLIHEAGVKLSSILNERDNRITNYIDTMNANAGIISSDPRLVNIMEQLTENSGAAPDPSSFKTSLKYLIAGHGFYDILLIDKAGNVTGSLRHEPDPGKNIFSSVEIKDSELAAAVKISLADGTIHTAGFDYYAPAQKYAMFITAPVIINSRLIGIAAFRIDNEGINALTENYDIAGKSGEMVVGIKKGENILIISRQMRGKKNAFETSIKIGESAGAPMQLALNGKSGDGFMFDYSGARVLAAWKYSNKAGWGVVVKEDRDEIMGPVREMNLLFLVAGVIIVFAAAYAAWRAAAEAVWPIIVLADAAKNMSRGDLGARAIIHTNDEIQLVADNFNEMAAIMQENDKRLKSINEKLLAETKKARYYIDVSEALIIELDVKGDILTVNRKVEETLGYSLREIAGNNWFDKFIPHEMKERFRTTYANMMKGREPNKEHFEIELVTKNGGIKNIYMHNTIIKDESGNVVRAVSSGIDITNLRNVEKELRQSEESFRLVFEKSIAGKVIMSPEGGVIQANEAFAKMLGYTMDELKGRSMVALTYADDTAESKNAISGFIAGTRENYRGEKRYIHKSGGIVWADVSTSLLRDNAGKPEKLIATIIDITERKHGQELLMESEEKFRSTFEQAQVGVVLVSPRNRFIKVNEKFCKMTGYSASELYEKNFAEITSEDDVERDLAGVGEVAAGKKDVYFTEKKYIRKDGGSFWAATNVSAVRKEGILQNFSVIIEDISIRKKAEEELISILDKLERSNQELEQFAFVASHDLQEPLRAVTGYIQLLDRKYSGKIDEDADKYIKSVVSGAGRMRDLINDLLSFSRIESGAKEPKEIDMNAVFGTVVYGLGQAISESGAVVTKDELPKVIADETQMVQLLQNLIANAIKFHGADRPVIHVSAGKQGKETVFSVKDNGIGIEKQYFDRIFVIFQRLHSRDEYPGTGIGLSICKKIVEGLGGRIWVESEPGKGSTFYFILKKEA